MNDKIILYTTNCPKCRILEKMLDSKGIVYEKNTDVDEMLALGLSAAPALAANGTVMNFTQACQWIKTVTTNEKGEM